MTIHPVSPADGTLPPNHANAVHAAHSGAEPFTLPPLDQARRSAHSQSFLLKAFPTNTSINSSLNPLGVDPAS